MCRNLGFEDKPDYTNYRRMFSDLMTAEGYTYDYQYDWLLRKSDREALRGLAVDDKDDEEDKEEAKVMTKAEVFNLKYQKPSEIKEKPDIRKAEESKRTTKDATAAPPTEDKNKVLSKKPSTNRKTFNGKPPEDKEEAKKPSIFDAMKGDSYGAMKPKIVTNNVRSYRF